MRIEEVIEQFGLTVFETPSLASLPGSIRYRMRLEPSAGVLEVLYWPVRHRLWVCACAVCDPVVRDLATPLAQAIAQVFGGRAETVVQPMEWETPTKQSSPLTSIFSC